MALLDRFLKAIKTLFQGHRSPRRRKKRKTTKKSPPARKKNVRKSVNRRPKISKRTAAKKKPAVTKASRTKKKSQHKRNPSIKARGKRQISQTIPPRKFHTAQTKVTRPERVKGVKMPVVNKKKSGIVVRRTGKITQPPKGAGRVQALDGLLIGEITHYFSKITVGVVKVSESSMRQGDQIRIKGKITDFVQEVKSLQIESREVNSAQKGQLVGLKFGQAARVGDKVYKL